MECHRDWVRCGHSLTHLLPPNLSYEIPKEITARPVHPNWVAFMLHLGPKLLVQDIRPGMQLWDLISGKLVYAKDATEPDGIYAPYPRLGVLVCAVLYVFRSRTHIHATRT